MKKLFAAMDRNDRKRPIRENARANASNSLFSFCGLMSRHRERSCSEFALLHSEMLSARKFMPA